MGASNTSPTDQMASRFTQQRFRGIIDDPFEQKLFCFSHVLEEFRLSTHQRQCPSPMISVRSIIFSTHVGREWITISHAKIFSVIKLKFYVKFLPPKQIILLSCNWKMTKILHFNELCALLISMGNKNKQQGVKIENFKRKVHLSNLNLNSQMTRTVKQMFTGVVLLPI